MSTYASELSKKLEHIVNAICKRAFDNDYEFTLEEIDYLKKCNTLLGISTPDTYDEGF